MIDRTLVPKWLLGTALAASLGAGSIYVCTSADDPASCCSAGEEPDAAPAVTPGPTRPEPAPAADLSRPPTLPDTPLVDQGGRPVRFYSDLVRGRVVALSFIFTTCEGVCPPIGANVSKLARDPGNRDVRFISVSVDPLNDTPARLARWSERFGPAPNWTLLTGAKQDVDALLKSLGVFSPDKVNHSPLILVGNDRSSAWKRVGGLSAAETIQASISAVAASPAPAPAPADTAADVPDSPAHRYFTDVPLVDQYGETRRLYSDLLRGKTVVVHVFFASCKNTCPVMMSTFRKLQDHLGDRLGRDVHLISLTVDPDHDDAAAVSECARRVGAKRGWYLLTGTKENVGFALAKLGQSVKTREDHSNLFLVGNVPTQLWKKVRGLDPVGQITGIIDGVIADTGDVKPSGEATDH